MKKDIFEMHEGIPIWKHLMNNGEKHETRIMRGEYGRLAEMIGKRELRLKIKYNQFIDALFPDVTVLSTQRVSKKSRYSKEYGDFTIGISYQNKSDQTCGKKVLIVEIKYGLINISQQQLRRYCNYIINPSAYFRKANEVKVIFMFFTEINTTDVSATYYFSELNKDFATKIADAIPKIHKSNNNDPFRLFPPTTFS